MLEKSYKDEDSFLLLMAKLLFNLALLVAPFVIPFYLPPALVVSYWLLTHLAEWIENRLAGAVDTTFIWMLGGCFGMSCLVADWVSPDLTGTLAGLACFIGLLVAHEGWKKLARLTIKQSPVGPRLTRTSPVAISGANAWSGQAPVTPDGETVRVLSCSEFVMGGPAVCDYLLPDGSVILGAGASVGFSPNGRYFVSPAPSRTDWPLLIYDRKRCLLYTCDVQSRFWEIDLVGDLSITGRESPLVSNQSWTAMIDDLIAHAQQQSMVTVAGLKIPENHWAHLQQRYEQAFPGTSAGNAPNIEWKLRLPDDLRALENPLDPLYSPMGEIFVDQTSSGLLMPMAFPVVIWRADNRALVCEASRLLAPDNHAWWQWTESGGWSALPAPQDLSDHLPYGVRRNPIHLDERQLTIEWELLQPQLSEDHSGTLSSYGAHGLEIDGQWFAQPVLEQRVCLGDDQAQCLASEPLANGERLIWRLSHRHEALSRDIYRCAFRGQPLEGEWLLDHRISSNGRQIALIAWAPPPAVPHRIALLHDDGGELDWLEGDYLAPQLQGFADDHLHLIHVTGHQALDDAPPIRDDLPSPDQASDYLQPREGLRLYHERVSISTKDRCRTR